MQSLTFEAIGTNWQIDIEALKTLTDKKFFTDLILKRIADFDKIYSRFYKKSFVQQLAKKSDSYNLPRDASPLFDLYFKLYSLTHGKFTPLIGQTLVDAGYDSDYSLVPKKLTTPYTWQDAIAINSTKLIMKKPALLDFGAAGKGYLVDLIGKLLEKKGIKSYVIDASGDILQQTESSSQLRVGLENPNNTKQVLGVVNIQNESVCGSAGNRRKWGKYHHIIDPHTLSPVSNILATWVISKTAIVADALATCLFLVNPELLNQYFKYDYLIVYQDFSILKSAGFKADLFFKK